jgi:hypothetical protein
LSPRTAFRRSRSERSFLAPTLTRIHSSPRRSGTASCRRFGWALSGSTRRERAALCFSTPPRSSGAWDTTSKSSFLGPDPSRVPARPSLLALGYAHKGRECQRVVQIVRSFHFGCLLSRVEASRVLDARVPSPRHRPIITTAVGGIVGPTGPACGVRSRLMENGSPRPSPRFFESPHGMRR